MNYITLYSPQGNAEIYPAHMKETLLAAGYQTVTDFGESQQLKADQEHAAWLADEANKPELFSRLRMLRDTRLANTDYMVMPDYPISQDKLAEMLAFRQALRDLPEQDGAPWDGGGENTPWPVLE